jgi:anthranilate phosphoribosyltransferase
LTKLTLSEIKGGDTVENSAKLFMQILEGNGTPQQNAVVVANAGMALYCANQSAGIAQGMARAAESLTSGKALDCFKRLLNT